MATTSAFVSLGELLRRRHRGLQTRMAALEFDRRARRERVVQLAEELVAHATVEQLVLYPYAEELLGVRDLSLEIERSLDALLGVIGGLEDETTFAGAMARLTASFERHVDGDEMGLLPMVEALGAPDQIVRMEQTIEEFERALSSVRTDEPWFLPDDVGEVVARGGWKN
jgi:hemerythrin-like domain-containing protein